MLRSTSAVSPSCLVWTMFRPDLAIVGEKCQLSLEQRILNLNEHEVR